MACHYSKGFLFFKWGCSEPAAGICMKCMQPACAAHSHADFSGHRICNVCEPSERDSDDDRSDDASSSSDSSASASESSDSSSDGGSDSGGSDSGSSSD